MEPRAFPYLFGDQWEYLDFKRSRDPEALQPSACGSFTARIRKEGRLLTYTLVHLDGPEITASIDRFRATAGRLRSFYEGCARILRDMKRFLRTGDPDWLNAERPFGILHGGITLPSGNIVWRGDADEIDPDEWIDLVEDESLARLLHKVDCLTENREDDPEEEKHRKRAWDLLESVPECHQNHAEVLRRRLQRFALREDFQDHASSVRWARALVEAEPYDVVNWWSLELTTEALEGPSAAVRVLREGIRCHGPDFSLHYSLAGHLCALGQLDEAREAMILALKADPLALESSLTSECFAPIHDTIRNLKESDWYAEAREWLEQRSAKGSS